MRPANPAENEQLVALLYVLGLKNYSFVSNYIYFLWDQDTFKFWPICQIAIRVKLHRLLQQINMTR